MMLKASLDEIASTPPEAGRLSALAFAHGSMQLRHYAPTGTDRQTPHDQDEVYIVISGRGTFVCAGKRVEFGPGDALFAAAGADHRFEGFSEDFATWVVFYGPQGGEAP